MKTDVMFDPLKTNRSDADQINVGKLQLWLFACVNVA